MTKTNENEKKKKNTQFLVFFFSRLNWWLVVFTRNHSLDHFAD